MNILLIGGRSALGKAIAAKLSHCTIIATSRRPPFSPQMRYLDLNKKSSVNEFISSIQNEGPFDGIIFTAANHLTLDRFEKISVRAVTDDLVVNVINPLYLLQQIRPLLSTNALVLFTLSEVVIDTPPPFFSSYVISKYALLGAMKALAVEWKGKVRVNAISPGMMDTPFIKNLPSFLKEQYKKAAGRLVTVDEVAEQVLLLLEKQVSGENIVVRP